MVRMRVLAGLSLLVAMGGAGVRAAPVVAGFERFHRASAGQAVEGGLVLLTELNCVACHAASDTARPLLPGRAPASLETVGARLSREALRAFVADPHQVKPGTTMPAMRPAAAALDELADYLSSLRGPADEASALLPGSVETGRRLYHEVGCAACHAPERASAAGPGKAAGEGVVVPLALAARYTAPALVQFLQDPLKTRPAGRMPSSGLSAQEAADLAAYLQRGGPVPPISSDRPTAARVAAGRAQFLAMGCAACHQTGPAGESSAVAAGAPQRRPARALAELSVEGDRGCLASTPGPGRPHYGLDEAQRGALRAAMAWLKTDDTAAAAAPDRQVARFMERLNCYACHSRAGRGGVEPGRLEYFTANDPDTHSLGDMGHLPPALDHTGRKLTRVWWEKLLWQGGGGVRPYLNTRMPQFGRSSCEPVLAAWAEADRRAEPVMIDTSGQRLHQRSAYGRALIGTNDGGLGCITCHGLRDRKSLGLSVINLTHTAQRLLPAYFKELLLNPQGVQPGTLMPPMLLGREKADVEIEQLWTYLKEIDQVLLPEAMLQRGEYELKPAVAGRPIVFRTFLDGAGLQAVAVGFPEGLNAAFDAAEVRWALTWRGRFLDAMTTWEERMMTPARPLGEAVTTLPAWMPLARLNRATDAWPESWGDQAGYRDLGYRLEADGAPVFLYAVGPLRVEDTLRPASSGGGWSRRLVIRGGGPGWYFRGLAPGAAPRPITFDAGGEARVEETWP